MAREVEAVSHKNHRRPVCMFSVPAGKSNFIKKDSRDDWRNLKKMKAKARKMRAALNKYENAKC